jgi:hypothetical protein
MVPAMKALGAPPDPASALGLNRPQPSDDDIAQAVTDYDIKEGIAGARKSGWTPKNRVQADAARLAQGYLAKGASDPNAGSGMAHLLPARGLKATAVLSGLNAPINQALEGGINALSEPIGGVAQVLGKLGGKKALEKLLPDPAEEEKLIQEIKNKLLYGFKSGYKGKMGDNVGIQQYLSGSR